jgi:peptidoglycan/LPS O-acetylase OafA/YrhL
MSDCRASYSANYRPDIDGLRAVAVLAVVFFHAHFPGFSGGFVGVDVFFVISGYLITGIIWRELQSGSFSLSDFYMRRAKRIFPALFTVLMVCAAAASFLLIPSDLEKFGRHLNSTVLFYTNFDLLKVHYFDNPSVEKPLLHAWSLSVEEQFYVIWPVSFFLMARYLPRRLLLPAIIALAAFSLALSEYKLSSDHEREAFFLPHYRAWELLTGAVLAIAPRISWPRMLAEILAAAGLAAIIYAAVFYSRATAFPGVHALLPCAGAAFIIASCQMPTRTAQLLSLRPVRFVGLISYSLYLIHWPLFSFATLYLNGPLDMPHGAAAVLVSILLAYLSWRFVETPARRAKLSYKPVLMRAGAAMGALCCVGVVFQSTHGLPSRVDDRLAAIDKLRDGNYSSYCRKASIPEIPSGLACEFGDTGREGYDFILWGDSHADHYVPAIDTLAKSRNLRGLKLALAACPPFLNVASNSKKCRELNAGVVRWMHKERLRFALLAARWTVHIGEMQSDMQKGAGGKANGLAATLNALEKLTVPAIVLDQVPEFERNIPHCITREMMQGRNYDWCLQQRVDFFRARHKPVDEYFDFLRKRHTLAVASPLRLLCDGEICRAAVDGEILVRDDNHLTRAGALRAIPYLNIPGLTTSLAASNASFTRGNGEITPPSPSATAIP